MTRILAMTPYARVLRMNVRKLWKKCLIGIRILAIAFLGGVCLVSGYILGVSIPAERKLRADILRLEYKFRKLGSYVDELTIRMTRIDQRVDHVYQVALGVSPSHELSHSMVEGAIVPVLKIPNILVRNGDFIEELNKKVDRLHQRISEDSMSACDMVLLAEDRQRIFARIPAIQPISKLGLSSLASGFGMRMHPFEHVIKMHHGMDFAAPEGTAIYATADGEVMAADTAFVGYGTMVIVDHGYGYQTRYAHLRKFVVVPGDRVSRGQRIGYVGNTGLSTASHLHYEVLLYGVPVNPIHYFFHDMSPHEYAAAFRLAVIQNQSMGN